MTNGQASLSFKETASGGIEIETKPHGHGDVHHLLMKSGMVDKWAKAGVETVVFLQDTNALVINGLLPAVGATVKNNYDMTSICIPRLAGEAAGAICELKHKDPKKSIVINVEYNQLDPMLRASGGADEPDATGFSPYPGNANNLVFSLPSYSKTVKGADQGVCSEFVNPKYKDDGVTFKKPTRLECMMQDFPYLLRKEIGEKSNVGFVQFDRFLTFSPAKNSLESGVESVSKGVAAPGTLSTAESDGYICNCKKLMLCGNEIEGNAEGKVKLAGIPVMDGPFVVLSPRFALTKSELGAKFTNSKISRRSSLHVVGKNVTIRNLSLDGSLVIKCPDARLTVDGFKCKNKGWRMEDISGQRAEECDSIRGFKFAKEETREIVIEGGGDYFIGEDGVLQKVA